MKHVDLSVLITNYNHEQFLPECLDAVFAQSVTAKEVIVVDDASSRDCSSIIRRYQEEHPELIFLQNPTNLGPAKAMNRAIHRATGKYLVLAAADDKVLSGFFEKAVSSLETNLEAGIFCSKPSFFKTPDHLWTTPISYETGETFLSRHKIQKAYLHTPLWIPTHASMYRKDLVIKNGSLEEGLKHLCDWYLNCKIALEHGVIVVPDSFGAFRLSPQSYGSVWGRSYRKKVAVYKKLFTMLLNESEKLKRAFRQSGVLGLITADVFFYLMGHISLWKYIPFAFYRKARNFLRKIKSKRSFET